MTHWLSHLPQLVKLSYGFGFLSFLSLNQWWYACICVCVCVCNSNKLYLIPLWCKYLNFISILTTVVEFLQMFQSRGECLSTFRTENRRQQQILEQLSQLKKAILTRQRDIDRRASTITTECKRSVWSQSYSVLYVPSHLNLYLSLLVFAFQSQIFWIKSVPFKFSFDFRN